MKKVSDTYNAYPDSRKVDVKISFRLLDEAASQHATINHNGAEKLCDVSQVLTEENASLGKYATLEKDFWALDGTWRTLPDQTINGYWSTALSGSDCTFEIPPTLTLSLSQAATSIGFSLRFDDQVESWPASVKITVYSGTTVLQEKTVSNDGTLLAADMPVENYDKVSFEFLKSDKPYRRIKIYEVLFGIVQQFDSDNIVTATFKAGCTIDSESVPTRELVFVFNNQDKKYNFVNPKGIYRYLKNDQEIHAQILIDGEPVDMGTHYFTRAEAKDDALTAEITANDPIYWLDNETYEEGTWGQWTLNEALEALLGGKFELDVPTVIGERMVNKCIPLETSKREALQLLAQAVRCSCWVDRLGKLVFRELSISDQAVDILTEDNMESMDGISTSENYDRIDLTVRDVFSNSEKTFISGEGTNIYRATNPCVYNGQAVADWLLSIKRYRLQYDCISRGNPAVEVGDTITIYNAYDEPKNALVYEYEITFDGGLTEETKAIGAVLQ